jgi:hypothetical protein
MPSGLLTEGGRPVDKTQHLSPESVLDSRKFKILRGYMFSNVCLTAPFYSLLRYHGHYMWFSGCVMSLS